MVVRRYWPLAQCRPLPLVGRRRECRATWVGDQEVHFAWEATRWLEEWLDSALTLRESRRRVLNQARKADAAVRRIVGKHGAPPASARNLQQALIHGTPLYGAELTWNGTKSVEKEVQGLTNRMGRASLGVRRTTPLGIVRAESALPPARALLGRRQARFALRLMARLRGGGGQGEILDKKSGLAARGKEKCA